MLSLATLTVLSSANRYFKEHQSNFCVSKRHEVDKEDRKEVNEIEKRECIFERLSSSHLFIQSTNIY